MVRLPRQDDYRTFCMSNETEKVYQKLEEAIWTAPLQLDTFREK